ARGGETGSPHADPADIAGRVDAADPLDISDMPPPGDFSAAPGLVDMLRARPGATPSRSAGPRSPSAGRCAATPRPSTGTTWPARRGCAPGSRPPPDV